MDERCRAARAHARGPADPLTWAEICERYPDEWVCLDEIDYIRPGSFEFRTARVVSHGKTRREAFDHARPWRAPRKLIGHYFTGRVHHGRVAVHRSARRHGLEAGHRNLDAPSVTGGETFEKVLIKSDLRKAIERINLRDGTPWLDGAHLAGGERTRRIAAPKLIEAN